jgi:WD40 repeat protein/tetratricopeptide (TPR) repeat protein
MSIDDSRGFDLLDRLAEEFADRYRRGERPSLSEYIERYPHLADDIRGFFPALVRVEQVEEICQEGHETAAEPLPVSQVGDYRIIREIGHGGMGVVYEAEQISLGRRVALKVLPWQVAKDRTTLERFRREARASARLHHSNIVPVFEVGQEGDIRYYAMQFIHGQSLDAVIDELRRLRGRSPVERGGRPAAAEPATSRRADSHLRRASAGTEVALSLLSGRFEHRTEIGPNLPTDDPSNRSDLSNPSTGLATGPITQGADEPGQPEPVATTAHDSSAVMPGGAQLSSVEMRHRAFHRAVAQIGRQAALALAYAHPRGITHRDIKPSNLLLDTEGVVWVSDFGLASVDDDSVLTRTGDVLGTFRYMAPERFRGKGDVRADIYSLGLTLYELLLLRPAFDAPDRMSLCEQIETVEPPRPRSIDSRVPRDLETIVLKAIEKDPRARYATADAMAEDLRRFLVDEPIHARRVAAHERCIRWARRNPAIAVLGGVLTAVLIGATLASVLAARRMAALADINQNTAQREHASRLNALAAQKRAETDRQDADRQRERAERNLYIARIGQAASALRLYDAATARGLLDLCRPRTGELDQRGWEWQYLHQWCHPALRTLTLPQGAQSRSVAVSPDGRLLAVGCWDPDAITARAAFAPVSVHLISLPDGRGRMVLNGHNLAVCDVAFRPDGRRLATLGYDGTMRVWDTETGRPIRTLSLETRPGQFDPGLSWSPDGRWLAGAAAGVARIWDPETGREPTRIDESVNSVAWSPDGSRIALCLHDTPGLALYRWDAQAERVRGPAFKQSGKLRACCWSPDGRRLAELWWLSVEKREAPGRLTIRDVSNGKPVFEAFLPAVPNVIAFSRDGTCVATGGEEEAVRIFDVKSGQEQAALFTGANQVSGLAFSADSRRLHAAGWGIGGIKLLDPDRDPRVRHIPMRDNQIGALAFDRHGLRIFNAHWRVGQLSTLDPHDRTVVFDRALPVSDARLWPRGDFAFSPDGGQLAAPTRGDRTVVGVWDVALAETVAELRGSGEPVTAVAYRPDKRMLATAAFRVPSPRSIVTLWDLASGHVIRTFEMGPTVVWALAFSDDGRKVAAGGGMKDGPGWVTAWDVESGTRLGALDRLGVIMSVAFRPDGSRIAVADFGHSQVHLWDLAAGTLITHPGPAQVCCVRFTPDGMRLAVLGYDGNVHLADAQTGDDVLVLQTFSPPAGGGGYTPRIAFSPDGSRIAANALHDVVNVWDVGPASGLAVEPATSDVAGWLCRGRALAESGDDAGAESAWARARDIKGRARDASPWIEHAAWLYRRGDSAQARDVLARVMDQLPDDRGQWADLAWLLGRLGWTEGAAMARTRLERRLARAPDDEVAVAGLTELSLKSNLYAGWTTLRPDVIRSAEGSTLTALPDGSVLASGLTPMVDTYTIETAAAVAPIAGLRLEALTHPSLPHSGPGRAEVLGDFVLDEIRLSAILEPKAVRRIPLIHARADHAAEWENLHGVSGALDVDRTTGWSISPRLGADHWAVFRVAEPFRATTGTRLRIELSFRSRYAMFTLGRFRLSVTDRPLSLFEPSVAEIRDSRTRLGAVYVLRGEWALAAAVLERSAARPQASALDGFLLALARHHLGRHSEARSACDRALVRLGSDQADDATRLVAVEALLTIRGLNLDEAESLVLDAVFPAEPFAR